MLQNSYYHGEAIITVATSCRNDPEGLWFTLHSALTSVIDSGLEGKIRLAVINNSDNEEKKVLIREMCKQLGFVCSYKEETFLSNHKGRNEAIRLSKTPYTVLCDAHVIFSANYFRECLKVLEERPVVGLVHTPFSFNFPAQLYRQICFYNTQHWYKNLHGTYSRGNALWDRPYPVVIAPHAAVMFRTKEWNEFGGYMDICQGHGGGEPFVSYKYWLFGKQVWVTPNAFYIHKRSGGYHKSRGVWRENFARTAFALAGYELGKAHVARLGCKNVEQLWKEAEPYNDFVQSKQIIQWKDFLDYLKEKKARPLSSALPD
jgi:hypothetical protein